MSVLREQLADLNFDDVAEPGEADLPIEPGEILETLFLRPLHLSAKKFATSMEMPANCVTEILNGERAITIDTAIRFAGFFKTTPHLWMNLQTNYDVAVAALAGAKAHSVTGGAGPGTR